MFILQLGVCNLTGFCHLSSRWDFSLMQRADQAKHFGKWQLTCGVWVGLCPERNHWRHQADFWWSASSGFTHGIWFAWPQPRVPSLQLAVCTADVNSEGLALWDWTFDQLLYLLSLKKYLEKYSSLSSHNLTLNASSFFFPSYHSEYILKHQLLLNKRHLTLRLRMHYFFLFCPPPSALLKSISFVCAGFFSCSALLHFFQSHCIFFSWVFSVSFSSFIFPMSLSLSSPFLSHSFLSGMRTQLYSC